MYKYLNEKRISLTSLSCFLCYFAKTKFKTKMKEKIEIEFENKKKSQLLLLGLDGHHIYRQEVGTRTGMLEIVHHGHDPYQEYLRTPTSFGQQSIAIKPQDAL